jgi:predicted nucleic acid-binding protein
VTVFVDSSALVKRYADEPVADRVRALESAVVCAIARVEVPAAIWRKQRLGELAPADAAVLVEQFEWEWHGDDTTEPAFSVVGVNEAGLESAALACARHGLPAHDAVQLAAAMLARDADESLISFACFDRDLADAAAQEGFAASF